MKFIRTSLCWTLTLIYTFLFVYIFEAEANAGVEISINGPLIQTNLPRYGLNLGGSGTWGAEHLRANLLANPGFEPVLDRTLIVTKESGRYHFLDDTSWLARPDGFWDGADFEIRSGNSAGLSGRVITSIKRPSDGLAEFITDKPLDALRAGDIAVLTRKRDTNRAPQWWLGHGNFTNSREIRPGSSGQQALRMLAAPGQPAELLHYFDTINNRAGKLILVNGKWKIAFWGRSAKPDTHMHLYFGRSGSRPFMETDVKVGIKWKYYVFDFNAVDNGIPSVITLSLTATDGEILIDDAYLGQSSQAIAGFRSEVIDTLITLQPGYLRDWQGQLGDTLRNRIAGEFAHQPVRYRLGKDEVQFHYGLADFFELCAAVRSRPWVVAPTSLSDNEWRELGAYLKKTADSYKFDEILVEFGNENWNQIFRPGGIPDANTHASVADRAFRLMREGSISDRRIISVVNSQFVNPDSPRLMGKMSKNADRIAVAPYFLYSLDGNLEKTKAHQVAFDEGGELLQKEAAVAKSQNKILAVYEVNFHTTLGNANNDLRNSVVTGAASGPALVRKLMQATLAGVREQAVYVLSGYDTYLNTSKDLVKLWGITRDLSKPNNFRPTGLALAMLNKAAGGKTNDTICLGRACQAITALSYWDGNRVAIVSASNEPIPIKVKLNCVSDKINFVLLDGSMSELNNEQEMRVSPTIKSIDCLSNRVNITLPGHSFAVLTQ